MPDNESLRVYLSKVHLKGYKSIDDLSIDFQKGLNILIGKNGSGKSNFLECISNALSLSSNSKIHFEYAKLDYLTGNNSSFSFEMERHLRKHPSVGTVIERGSFNENFYINGALAIENEKQSRNYSRQKALLTNGLDFQLLNHTYIKFSLPDDLQLIATAATFEIDLELPYIDIISPFNFINYIIWVLERSLDNDDDTPNLRRITAKEVLNFLEIPKEIKQTVKKYSPIQDVRFNNNINVYTDEKILILDNIKLEFKINNSWIPWSQLSDGTKRIFYIIAEVTYSNGLILLEEPELGIHPHQFILLMDFLKEQSESKQIIISTHSPKALDHLSENELDNILIADYTTKKGTQIRHLTSKEQTKAKKYMKEVGFFSDYWMHSDLE